MDLMPQIVKIMSEIKVPSTSGEARGKRIMDLDQYLEKMITNTEFI